MTALRPSGERPAQLSLRGDEQTSLLIHRGHEGTEECDLSFVLRLWLRLCERIEERYEMDRIWSGGKAWDVECKHRRGEKTLCALYAKEGCFGFMVVLGKDERSSFEADRASYAEAVQLAYDGARAFRADQSSDAAGRKDERWMQQDASE